MPLPVEAWYEDDEVPGWMRWDIERQRRERPRVEMPPPPPPLPDDNDKEYKGPVVIQVW